TKEENQIMLAHNTGQSFLKFGNNRSTNAAFPLTPALSLGERENRSPVLRQPGAHICSKSGIRRLPLPWRDCRNEGKIGLPQSELLVSGCGKQRVNFIGLSGHFHCSANCGSQ